MRELVICWAALFASGSALAQDEQVDRVLNNFDSIRPSARELNMYRIDWADSLAEAQMRATRESRPVALIIIHAKYGDIQSGHC